MEKLVVLAVLLLTGFSTTLEAQCNSKKALSTPAFFQQDPSAKAALIAAADETIEERVDSKTGQKYYVREYASPWSGETSYHLVTFDPVAEKFIERQDYASNGEEEEHKKGTQTPSCHEKKDSTNLQQRTLLPDNTTPVNKQPRRSSRVKLAADF